VHEDVDLAGEAAQTLNVGDALRLTSQQCRLYHLDRWVR